MGQLLDALVVHPADLAPRALPTDCLDLAAGLGPMDHRSETTGRLDSGDPGEESATLLAIAFHIDGEVKTPDASGAR